MSVFTKTRDIVVFQPSYNPEFYVHKFVAKCEYAVGAWWSKTSKYKRRLS